MTKTGDRAKRALFITYNGVDESIFQSQCLPYLKGLASGGHVITLVSYQRDPARAEAYSKQLEGLGIRWYRLKYHKAPRFIMTCWDFALGAAVSLYLVLRHGIDIIHARATHAAVIGMPAAMLPGRKLIFDMRGLDSEEYVDGGLMARGSVLHKMTLGFERMILRRADAVVLLSGKAMELLKDRNMDRLIEGKPVSVIPCATDLGLFRCAKKQARPVDSPVRFVYTGSVGTWYMLDEMLKFVKAAAVRFGVNMTVFSIYTQSGIEYVKQRVSESGLEGIVSVGFVDHDRVPEFLRESDAGLCFIRPVSSKRASSPTKVGEYLACGLPVIITGAIGDAAGLLADKRVGIVIDDFSELHYNKALTELEGLIKDPALAERCRRAAEEYFSLDKAVEEYGLIYGKLKRPRERTK
ncbi:MAG: glycosyltransferase family 4 protein [Candidatus Omnitrophota bacterium]